VVGFLDRRTSGESATRLIRDPYKFPVKILGVDADVEKVDMT
jgi:hypothetical protein